MKPSELRGRTADDLRQELARLRRQLFDLRFQWQAQEKPDTSQRLKLRRDIARIQTVLREMELASAKPNQTSGRTQQVTGAAQSES